MVIPVIAVSLTGAQTIPIEIHGVQVGIRIITIFIPARVRAITIHIKAVAQGVVVVAVLSTVVPISVIVIQVRGTDIAVVIHPVAALFRKVRRTPRVRVVAVRITAASVKIGIPCIGGRGVTIIVFSIPAHLWIAREHCGITVVTITARVAISIGIRTTTIGVT